MFGDACKLLQHAFMGGNFYAWSSIGILLLLLLRRWRSSHLGVLGCCGPLLFMFIETLVSPIAHALGKVRAWRFSHVLSGQLLPFVVDGDLVLPRPLGD